MGKIKYHSFDVQAFTNYQVIIKSTKKNTLILKIIEDEHFGEIKLKKFRKNIFNYFNGDLNKITIKCNYVHIYDINLTETPIQIKQLHMNDIFKITFMEDMVNIYKLDPYHDDYAPAIFYGVMDMPELNILKNNKSLKIIIWVGGDINHNVNVTNDKNKSIIKKIEEINKLTKVKHIAISSFIKQSLMDLSIAHKFVPFMGVNFDLYRPVIKGSCIYLYTDPRAESYYGLDLYLKLMSKYKNISFIVTCCKYYYHLHINNKIPLKYGMKYYDKNTLLTEIYPQCFIGLRLTYHDGLAATVQELGLLGIKSVHNGCSPSALNYNNFEDICRHIDNEIKTIGTCDENTALEVKKYLTIDKSFFGTDSYKDEYFFDMKFYRDRIHTNQNTKKYAYVYSMEACSNKHINVLAMQCTISKYIEKYIDPLEITTITNDIIGIYDVICIDHYAINGMWANMTNIEPYLEIIKKCGCVCLMTRDLHNRTFMPNAEYETYSKLNPKKHDVLLDHETNGYANLKNLINKYNIGHIISIYDCAEFTNVINLTGCKPHILNLHIDTLIFKNLNMDRNIDVLMYGADYDKVYPLRNRIKKIIKNMNIMCHIVDPSSTYSEKTCNYGLALLLNKSWLTVCTCSIYDYLVLKYFEASACGSVVLGNMATQGRDIWENNYIHIPDNATDNQIQDIILDALADKEKLIKISTAMSEKITNEYNYEKFATKLFNICELVK
jgi:hypothetical protein